MNTEYERFDTLAFDRPAEGVLRVTINRPEKMNALTLADHKQMEDIWGVIDEDPETMCTIVTGAGRAFCAGGDIDDVRKDVDQGIDFDNTVMRWRGGANLVYSMINARKPIVSAINGVAVGGGLCVALLADIPIAAKSATLIDGHTKLGVAAGDHAAIIWPLLCGMAKSKYYLMTSRKVTGEEAEKMNLVALAVEDDELQDKALEVASELAKGPQTAIRMTKYCLNHYLKQAGPIFDLSLTMELWGFLGPDTQEGMSKVLDRQKPEFKKFSEF